jgi:hypothetical protein
LGIGAAPHGHRGNLTTMAAISPRRIVAIEYVPFGTQRRSLWVGDCRIAHGWNRVMSMTAVVGEQANGAQLLTYFITVRQCPTGTNNPICVGGATQKIEANHSFRPDGDSYSFTSKLTFVR